MSSTGQGGPGDKKNEPKGLKKFIRRASLVLKPKSKRQSISGAAASVPKESGTAAGTSSRAPSSSSPPSAVSAPPKAGTATALAVPAQNTQSIKDNKPASTQTKPQIRLTAKEANALQEDKARAMFAKYGLTLEPSEWTTPVTEGAPRVEKQVRMRVHRICHRCQTTFGQDKLCNHCQHTRCKKCPRFPASKSKVKQGKGAAAGGVLIDDGMTKTDEALTMPNRATGKEMTRKSPTQRVRRTCHECQTLFVGKAVQCENCKHMRCAKCPRDPPKKEKYPEGFPGDQGVTNPIRTKSRWKCEKCETTCNDQETTCGNCGHEKCESCPRATPTKAPKPEEEAALQSVEERMRNLDVSPQASAA